MCERAYDTHLSTEGTSSQICVPRRAMYLIHISWSRAPLRVPTIAGLRTAALEVYCALLLAYLPTVVAAQTLPIVAVAFAHEPLITIAHELPILSVTREVGPLLNATSYQPGRPLHGRDTSFLVVSFLLYLDTRKSAFPVYSVPVVADFPRIAFDVYFKSARTVAPARSARHRRRRGRRR